MVNRRVALVGAILVLGACGGPNASSPLMMTCDIRANAGSTSHGQCQEWRGDVADPTNGSVDFDVICTSTLGGVVITGPCPNVAVEGLCTKRPSVAERVILHYHYAPDFDASTASTNCAALGGTFSTP